MSRTAASYSMTVTRGATWEDVFVYTEDDKVTPIDLTGYEARMQVRTLSGQFGLTDEETLLLELTTGNGLLYFDTAETGTLRIRVAANDTVPLNAPNVKKMVHAYSLELYTPVGVDPAAEPEYVIPLVQGKISVSGKTTR